MHFSAKRGIAIACRLQSVCLSVCPSVTLVDQDHIGRKSGKLIARSLSPTANTFTLRSPKAIHLLPGEHGEIFRRLEVGWEKMAQIWSTKAAISLKRVQIEEKLVWGAYRNSPSLFRTVPSRPPTGHGLPFSKIGGSHPTQNSNRYYLRSGLSYELQIWHSEGPSKQKPIKNFREKGAWAYPGTVQNFRVLPIISGTGKATDSKFGQYIQRVHPNKSPLKMSEKRARGRIHGLP